MKVTTYIANFLKEKGIDTIFELQGGMITRIIDEINKQGGINIISMHHEQAAAFAAEAYARITNVPGVAIATSGPGATNLITGIGSCYFDSVPAIFITGQVNLDEQKKDKITRQIGFQETDIVSIVKPITKAAFAITTPEEIPDAFEIAFRRCSSGRPGPVLIDIPMDIQDMDISTFLLDNIKKDDNSNISNQIANYNENFIQELKKSKKPLCLVGRGVRVAGAIEQFLNFVDILHLPVVTSLLGVDAIPYNHSNRIGFIGTYGNRWANYALGNCDLLLVLGSRLDLRQTGVDVVSFQKNKKIFHIDIEESELNNRLTNCMTLHSDLSDFFKHIIIPNQPFNNNVEWFSEIRKRYELFPDTNELKGIKGINPNKFIHLLSKSSLQAGAFCTDVGNNQMWSAQSIELQSSQCFLSAGGMGAMGYSLPAAIGASFALQNKPVICISGDGGFQINIQELQTIFRNKLPIKIVILNNNSLGMIRQFQDAYFDSCYKSTVWGYSAPDFVKVAQAYNIEASSIENSDEIEIGLSKLWKNKETPYLLNVIIDVHTNVYPKMMYGSPITKMEPEFITPINY